LNRNTVALVWLGGIVFAVLLYVSGPIHFVQASVAALNDLQWALSGWVSFLAVQAFDVVRAAAIALMGVALVLGLIAAQRGRGGGIAGITALFIGLVWLGGYYSRFCWFAALIVAAVGALSMTRQLLHGGNGVSRGPWGVGGGMSRRRA
jgi:hypothetical protein